jgi:hypothetical protein
MYAVAVSLEGPVDDEVLSAPYLKPEALVRALGSDDADTWQPTLRFAACLCSAANNTQALGTAGAGA